MKWGTKYGPDYVNRLHNMVRRHLTVPHRFVCFTDDGAGLQPGIEVKPLPPMDLPPGKERGWRKLSTFQAPLADLEGPVLFLDVDIVITGSLDPLFAHPGRFLIIHEWGTRGIVGNSSVYRFEANAHPAVFADFMANIDAVKANFRHEQAYLSDWMQRHGLLEYWPADWCLSFKRSCWPGFPACWWRDAELPTGTRVVVFHGNPNPPDAVAGRIRGWWRRLRPTPWVAEHWR
jgi:hypothetical protein